MDKYSITTDDLLYGLIEECVRREQEWRRRFEKSEEAHDALIRHHEFAMKEAQKLIAALQEQVYGQQGIKFRKEPIQEKSDGT